MMYNWLPYRFRIWLTPAVGTLIAVNAVLFVFQLFMDVLTGGAYTAWLGLSLRGIKAGAFWQPVTYMVLHGGLLHLFMNMLALYFIGPETERRLGTRRFYVLYFLSGLAGGLGWILLHPFDSPPCVGASGSVVGVVAAFATIYPHRRLTFIFFPFRAFAAWKLALVFAGIELVLMLGMPGSRIAHAVHLTGGLAGFAYVTSLRRGGWRTLFYRLKRKSPGRTPTEPGMSAADLDRILDKISRYGMSSLTPAERARLSAAGRRRPR